MRKSCTRFACKMKFRRIENWKTFYLRQRSVIRLAHHCAKRQMLCLLLPLCFYLNISTQSAKSVFASCHYDVANDLNSRLTRTEQTLHQRCKFCCFASGSMRHSHKSNPPSSFTSRMLAPVSWELLLHGKREKGVLPSRNLFLSLFAAAPTRPARANCIGQISMILDCVQIYYTVENCKRKLVHIVLHDFKVRLMQLIVSYRWALLARRRPRSPFCAFPVHSLRIYGSGACEDEIVYGNRAPYAILY